MNIETRDFGTMEIEEGDIVTFCQPIFGFESYSKYVMIQEQEVDSHFVWLQSVEEKELCFILVNPAVVIKNYSPVLPEAVKKLLGNGEKEFWLITVIPEEFQHSTVNLKSPIVINPAEKCAAQVILEEDFPIRYPLVPGKREGK